MKLNTLTPARMAMVFFTGLLLGILMISLGWAQSTPSKSKKAKAHKSSSRQAKRHHAINRLAQRAKAHKPTPPAPTMALKDYFQPDGLYQFSYPATWEMNAKDNAMILKTSGRNGERVVFGIIRRPDDQPNEDAVTQELETRGLTRAPARVGGLQATKIVSSEKGNPDLKMVEYYVQSFSGHQYYILMMAPRNEWDRHNIAFSKMLNTLALN